MTERIFDPDGCVGCDTDGRCIGMRSCSYCYRLVRRCDLCGEEIDRGNVCEACEMEMEEALDDNENIDKEYAS